MDVAELPKDDKHLIQEEIMINYIGDLYLLQVVSEDSGNESSAFALS